MDTNNNSTVASVRSDLLCILGMHRSGTSVVAQFLRGLGVAVAPQLLGAMEGVNPEGFWEDRQVVDLNEKLLSLRGRCWFDLGDANVVHDGLAESRIRQEAVDHIREHYASQRLSLVKDPRLCRLLPFWLDVWVAAEVSPTFIHVVRHPFAIAQSLHRRDRIPYEYSIALWLLHVLDAMWYSQGRPGLVVIYDDFLERPWELVETLVSRYGVTFSAEKSNWLEVADRAINKNLRHNNNSIGASLGLRELNTVATSLYDALGTFAYSSVDRDSVARWRQGAQSVLSLYADEMTMLTRLCSDLMHLSAESVRVGELHSLALQALADRDQFIRDLLRLKLWRLLPRILRKARKA